MAYARKFTGNTYFVKNKGAWDGQCPFWMGHAKKMNIPNWKKTIMFKKWHELGEKCRKRRTAKPYRLFWRLNKDQQSTGIKHG